MVYMEEFLLIHKGRIAFLLPIHVYKLWIAQGCRWESPDSHVLGIHLDLMGTTYTLTCVYIPTGQSFDQRKHRATVLECARLRERQSRQLHPDRSHVWTGDWNAHIGTIILTNMAVALGCRPLPHQRALNKDAGSLRPVY